VIPEAKLTQAEGGLVPEGEGWFVLNAREAQWLHTDGMGAFCTFEGDVRFAQLGINVNVLQPGEIGATYHAEDTQEGFLVLAGEGVLVVEGQERPLRAWDFFHCPPNAGHVLVGAGESPFVFVAVGARRQGRPIVYPVDEAAARHGASVAKETTSPQEAYEAYAGPRPGRAPDLPGW
jgi:uncharacterized cupin superfamily protein